MVDAEKRRLFKLSQLNIGTIVKISF